MVCHPWLREPIIPLMRRSLYTRPPARFAQTTPARPTIASPILRIGPATVCALAGAALIIGCSDEVDPRANILENQAMETINMDPEKEEPKFVFAPEATVEDPSLNAFIREFADMCIKGEYDRYRMKVSRRSDPVTKDEFERVWHNIREISIDFVVALPEKKSTPGPRYALQATVHVERPATGPERQVVLQILQEQEEWVIDALPGEELDRLQALATQPTTAPTTTRAAARM